MRHKMLVIAYGFHQTGRSNVVGWTLVRLSSADRDSFTSKPAKRQWLQVLVEDLIDPLVGGERGRKATRGDGQGGYLADSLRFDPLRERLPGVRSHSSLGLFPDGDS